MSRGLAVATAVVCLSRAAWGAEPEPPRLRPRYHLWKVPFYLAAGLPRDAIDAPSKALSSVPVFNRVFIVPLAALNAVTTVTSWSFTEEGIEGGFEAWFCCLRLQRERGKPLPPRLRNRPWTRNYCPNLRSFRIVTWEPADQ